MAANFNRGRSLSRHAQDAWRRAVELHVEIGPGTRFLDLGSGTGIFSFLLAEWFGCDVVGVEPSRRMRSQVQRGASGNSVQVVAGRAETLPLRSQSFAYAWLSNVIHHVQDRVACAAELARVLRPQGKVLVAGAFAGRLEDITLFQFFPEARRVAEHFPSIDDVTDVFQRNGLECMSVERVRQITCSSLKEFAGRTHLRADTTLQFISDTEFMDGQARLERAAEHNVGPVVETLDLIVFRNIA